MRWNWAWIEEQYRIGLSPRRIAEFHVENFGSGPNHMTIRRRASQEQWTRDEAELDVADDLPDFDQEFTEDAKAENYSESQIDLVEKHRRGLNGVSVVIALVWRRLAVRLASSDLTPEQESKLIAAVRAAVSATKDVQFLERLAQGLTNEVPDEIPDGAKGVNPDVILAAADHIRSGYWGDGGLPRLLTPIYPRHVSELPTGVVPLRDGTGDGGTPETDD